MRETLLAAAAVLIFASPAAAGAGFDGLSGIDLKKELSGIEVAVPAAADEPGKSRPPGSPAEWTVMVFLNGKNDLEKFALRDINEMEMVGSSDKVNIVVEAGRIAGYDSSEGDWKGVRRYLITRDSDTGEVGSRMLRDMGMADMGDYRSLAAFGKWAKAAYPARKYMLIVWNHGTGWDKSLALGSIKGISYDDESGSHINTPQLGMALRELGGVDVYVSDACLMQMPEVAYEIRNYAEYIVGSEAIEPNDGFTYNTFLGPLAARPGMDAAELGRIAVDTYSDRYQDLGKASTQSLLKASALGGFALLVDDFVTAAMAGGEKTLVRAASSGAQSYAGYDNKDMGHFLELYSASSGNAAVKAKALALQAYMNGELLVHSRVSGKYTDGNSRGLAVYLPGYYFDRAYPELAWAADTRWDEFTKWYLEK